MNDGDIYDLFAGVLRAVLVVALVGSSWLVYRSRHDQPLRREWINGVMVLGLMGLMWGVLDIRNDRISFISLLVVALAFNLGRWRDGRYVRNDEQTAVFIDRSASPQLR
jgi:hypothetical protein